MPAPVLQFKRGNAGVAGTVPALRPGEPAISLNNFDFFIGIDTSVINNKFFGSHRYWEREESGVKSLKLKLVSDNGSESINLRAPTGLGATFTYTLPATGVGNSGKILSTNDQGVLSWIDSVNQFTVEQIIIGIGTFSNNVGFTTDTDNTLGNPDTGAVQIDGGLGVNKNVTIGAGLSVAGESHFIGTATFYGGQINLGDSDGDNISVAGEFVSNLVPNATNTYDLGLTGKRWRDGYFSRNLNVTGNLTVDGNVSIGGTSVTLLGEDVFIKNKDIVLGYTTSVTNTDASTDDTANHAGVAIASTIGTPLVSFSASGINTLPDTYKQMMWFKQGTLGFGTDAFAFNYGVAIGTTTMATGVRLAVGSGITMSDTSISATKFYGNIDGVSTYSDQVKTVSAADNPANYYVTFVDSNNGTAQHETVYTDDGIYYNPGTNTFTTQNALFTGNVTVQGTLTGTATTATRATLIDTANTTNNSDYYVTFVDTLAGQGSETLRVGLGLSVNPSNGDVKTTGKLSVGNPGDLTSYIKAGGGSDAMYLYANGDVSFQQKVIVGGLRSSSNSNNTLTLNGLDATFAGNLAITGITTIGTGVGITQFSASVSTGTSTSSVPTSSAVIDYVGSQVGAIDLTLGLNADSGGPSTVGTAQTLTISGTANEIETSVAGQTVTIGLPNDVIVGTSLSAPTVRANIIQSQNTGSTVLTLTGNDATFADDLTVNGNLYVQGSTTQINTTTLAVEDRTIELGRLDPNLTQPTTTTWDLAVLFNYGDGTAKKAGVVWEASGATKRFQFTTDVDPGTDGSDSQTNLPSFTVSNFAPIEIGQLWVTDCAGTSQVISCTGSTRYLENITIDAGLF